MLKGSVFDEIAKKTRSQCLGTGMTPITLSFQYVMLESRVVDQVSFLCHSSVPFSSFQCVTLESRSIKMMNKIYAKKYKKSACTTIYF
ncbi:MAG: hypothetical protein ACR5K5_04075 [Wolbachia sp.]